MKAAAAQDNSKGASSWPKQVPQIIRTNVFKRAILGITMLNLFILLCRNNKKYIIIFVIGLTLGICNELILLVKKTNKPLSLNKVLVVYYVLVLYSMKVTPSLISLYPNLEAYYVVKNHRVLLFYSYAIGLMSLIFNLRKNRLSSQLLLIAVIHLAVYILGACCAYAMLNIERGQFYFFYPCILVISNDIFAYIIGKLFGRTQLYALSPNKTVEGFIGASFFTFIVGMLLSYLKLYYNFLPDSMDNIIARPVRPNIWYLNFPVMFLHNLSFSLYASFVAPFIGFLASAIKRVFNKKDFGAVIPGHGGLTDRMDCQLLMVFFTHFYLNSFFKTRTESVEHLSNYILNNYSSDEIALLINKLISYSAYSVYQTDTRRVKIRMIGRA